MSNNGKYNPVLRIVLIYLVLGLLWVLFSDSIVFRLPDRGVRMVLHTSKGWLFVCIFACLLYYLINRYVSRLFTSQRTLSASDERLRMALTASHMGVWEWDLRTDQVVWSPEVYDIVGLKDFNGEFASFGRLLHPEDAERVMASVQQALAGRVEYADEFRIFRPDSGEIRWLANLGQGRYDADGTPVSMLGTVRDITAIKTAQEALRTSEERLNLVLQNANDGVWDWDLRSGLAYLSPKYYEIVEYRAEDVVPDLDFFMSLVHHDDREHVLATMGEHQLGRTADSSFEFRILTGRGTLKWILGRGRVVLRSPDGAPLRMLGTVTDITTQKLAELALQASETRYRAVVEDQTETISRFRPDGTITFVNEACCRLIGKTSEELVGYHWQPDVHRDDMPLIEARLQEMSPEHPVVVIENRIFSSSGDERWMQFVNRGFYDDQGNLTETQAIGRDITARKRDEAQLIELNAKLRTLTEHLQTVQERERLAIARDIHDEIGQQLTALKLDIAWIGHHLKLPEMELSERLDGMVSCVDHLIASVQRIAAELRPPLLDNLGLAAAIEWQVSEFTGHSGIECIVMLNEDIDPQDQQISTSIVRIVQEALTNVMRHAEATEVGISLCTSAGRLLLEISDNGRGISESEIRAQDSYGLMGMQERARLCNGELVIDGGPEGGTRLRLTIPYVEGDSRE